ncbi:MAG: tetratricopeptide repeat protein [Synechococcales cyanobacterium M58_A2018_015]|nr:tetratricopeptide repeat protein [Synechococcales cyanobacterium M58_A2018_015]
MSRSFPRISPDKPLGGRYKIISQLGVGGFGRTFLAQDLHLPGHPRCVIKHLKPQIKSDDTLQMARRCFNTEAQVLYRLGSHDQIPQLLAHFEEGQEFYLAQEFIEGEPLTQELVEGRAWAQGRVVLLLKDILRVLTFVHQQQVIHRDLKPSNLIRRQRDGKIVLIDFGAVKQVGSQAFDPDTGLTNLTISIGTQGYMPNEQLAGKPRFSSDVYAVGILGIQMLTGIHPRHLDDDVTTGEVAWHDHAPQVSPELMAVIDHMVRYDFRERYLNAADALAALDALPEDICNPAEDYAAIPDALRLKEAKVEPTAEPVAVASGGALAQMSGQPAMVNLEPTSSMDLNLADEEPVSTAIWVHADALTQPMSNSMSTPSDLPTDLTHAVGRPYTGSSATATPASTWTALTRRVIYPWAWAGLLTLGMIGVMMQIVLPQLTNTTLNDQAMRESPVTVSPSPDPQQQAAELLAKADKLRQAEQYEEALAVYDQAIALRSDYAEAYAGRCETLNQLKRPEEAIVSCNDALAYKPNYPEALWSQGNARLLQNRPYDALKLYEDVTYLKPDFAEGWVKRGVALQELGRSAEALDALDQGIQLQRNSAEAWITKGEALLTLNRYDAAVTALDKALQLRPNDSQILELRQRAAQGK